MSNGDNNKDKRVPVSHILLWFLEKGVEGAELFIGSCADLKRDMYRVYNDAPYSPTEPAIAKAIKRLREKKLIEYDKRDTGALILKLTREGRDFAELTKKLENWDGKWRLVIFDIPESKRAVRNVLRSRLKQWGFEQWQKSVWATKKPIADKLRKIIRDLEVEDWVLVVESNNVGQRG
ncbi:CRISPR-associated endonuclease Cas2 [Candidatus Microgenomates bacterium]|nr:CRISPR-associated endonuclease Cas2 [Candidatus Microgenomates bacterium]